LWEPVGALPRSLAGPVLPALPACFQTVSRAVRRVPFPDCPGRTVGPWVTSVHLRHPGLCGIPLTRTAPQRLTRARCTLTFAGGAGSLLTLGLRRIPDPRASVSPRSQSPSTPLAVRRTKFVSCCVAEATVSHSLRVVQVALCSACVVQVSRCSPLGNRSPDHRHPGSLTRCAALLSSTLQAFARLCKCRCLVRPACLAACGASRCGDEPKTAPLAHFLSSLAGQSTFPVALRAVLKGFPGRAGPIPHALGDEPRAGSAAGRARVAQARMGWGVTPGAWAR
jgi:hypothetical protein